MIVRPEPAWTEQIQEGVNKRTSIKYTLVPLLTSLMRYYMNGMSDIIIELLVEKRTNDHDSLIPRGPSFEVDGSVDKNI